MNLGIIASHRGTNFQAIIDACRANKLNARVAVAISNNSKSLALIRARKNNIPAFHVSGKTHPNPSARDEAMLNILNRHEVDFVVLVGYLKRVGEKTLSAFQQKVINIHPALLPSYGGQGMYGSKIHEEVLKNRDTETGITIHYVDDSYDTGEIIAQMRIPIDRAESAASLAKKILINEHEFLISTLNCLISEELACRNRA